jgi:hypothetical protein
VKIDVFTSYHRGPSAHILINFSLKSSVSLSMFLRSNFSASMARSDFNDMMTDCCDEFRISSIQGIDYFHREHVVRPSDVRCYHGGVAIVG